MTSWLDSSKLPENPVVRNRLRAWQAQCGWSWAQVSSAIRLNNPNGSVPGAIRLERFVNGKEHLGRDQRRPLWLLLETYPVVDRPFEVIADELRAQRIAELERVRNRAILEPEQRERERAMHRRLWLGREQPANGRPAVRLRMTSSPLYGLDTATIRALSGGTL